VACAGERVRLLPERALHWPAQGLLAVGDLHWGKTEVFQMHGLPLPSGVLGDDLARLSRALTRTGARRLVLVGDLVHSARSMTPAVVAEVEAWRERHAAVEMVLVRGNHERHVQALPGGWRMALVEEHLDAGPFRFAHHPEPAAGRYVWSGHLHPTVVLQSGADRLRLPCFRVGREVAVLPAFSAFTGGGPRPPRRPAGERVFAVVEDRVLEV
jgi:DNA ligase-associated metallophosphoesterase